jgi:drug/metabolite transporter (DMT)-like permease
MMVCHVISSAMKETQTTLASLARLLQPALAFVWDVLVFSRPRAAIEVSGILLILFGIYLGSQWKR